MNIQNAVGVSYNRRSEMAGDHLKIRNVLEMTVRAEAIGNNPGGTVAGQEAQAFGGGLYDSISINGVSFGAGYVSNLSADPEGPDVQRKTYTVTVSIPMEGDLDKVLSSVSPEVSKSIDSISESYNIEQSTHRYNVTHSFTIKLNHPNPNFDGSSIVLASLKSRNKLDNIFGIGEEKVFNFKNYSYDQESQTWNYQDIKEWVKNELSDSSHIIVQQSSFEYSNGVINASFSAEVTGIKDGADAQSRADSALSQASSFLERSGGEIFGTYSDLVLGAKDGLKNLKTSKILTLNRNEAKASVRVTSTNALDIQEGSVYWEYGTETQKLAAETITTEQGKVTGGGPILAIAELAGSIEKYANAASFFGSNCSSSAAASRNGGGVCIAESVSRGYGEGVITYRYSFSDNEALLFGSNDGGATPKRKEIISTNNQDPLYLHSTFIIPELKELLQKQENILPNLKIRRSNITTNGVAKISEFLGSLFKPGDTSIVDNISIRYSPNKRECTAETTYYDILN